MQAFPTRAQLIGLIWYSRGYETCHIACYVIQIMCQDSTSNADGKQRADEAVWHKLVQSVYSK